MRLKHQQPDGFTIYASKTVGVPIGVLFDAFVDERTRATVAHRRIDVAPDVAARQGRALRLGRRSHAGAASRSRSKGPAKATAAVAHERLPDADAAETAKAAWKQRVVALKSFLESTDV